MTGTNRHFSMRNRDHSRDGTRAVAVAVLKKRTKGWRADFFLVLTCLSFVLCWRILFLKNCVLLLLFVTTGINRTIRWGCCLVPVAMLVQTKICADLIVSGAGRSPPSLGGRAHLFSAPLELWAVLFLAVISSFKVTLLDNEFDFHEKREVKRP